MLEVGAGLPALMSSLSALFYTSGAE